MSVIGIDVGTSSCKGLLLDDTAAVRGEARAAYEMLHDREGRSEVDSRQVCDGVWRVIRELASLANRAGDPVSAIAFAVSGNEATAIGEDGAALTPTVGSMDPRGGQALESWVELVDPAECYRVTGIPPHVMHPLMRLRWLRESEPAVFSRLHRFLCWGDLLALRLGAAPGIDYSMASCTMAFDIREHRWSDRLLEAAGIDAAVFGSPVRTGDVVGVVSSEVADELGLPPGVSVVAGGFDQPMAALGAGCFAPGSSAMSAGTWESLLVVTGEPNVSDALLGPGYVSGCYVVDDTYYTVANNPGGSSVMNWLVGIVGADEVRRAAQGGGAAIDLMIKQATPSPTGIIVTPHHAGAYNPWMQPRARGAVHGLTLSTSRFDVIKAFLEGVTFELLTNLRLMEAGGQQIEDIIVTGGGARSDLWMQLRADMLGRPLTRSQIDEPGCLAAAAVAGAAIGLFANEREPIQAHLGNPTIFDPDLSVSDRYAELHSEYLAVCRQTAGGDHQQLVGLAKAINTQQPPTHPKKD
jgi:xylulokinase